jgi:hypothetical protein
MAEVAAACTRKMRFRYNGLCGDVFDAVDAATRPSRRVLNFEIEKLPISLIQLKNHFFQNLNRSI